MSHACSFRLVGLPQEAIAIGTTFSAALGGKIFQQRSASLCGCAPLTRDSFVTRGRRSWNKKAAAFHSEGVLS
jgi:hypothetical protein